MRCAEEVLGASTEFLYLSPTVWTVALSTEDLARVAKPGRPRSSVGGLLAAAPHRPLPLPVETAARLASRSYSVADSEGSHLDFGSPACGAAASQQSSPCCRPRAAGARSATKVNPGVQN